jgi:transcriptional regulator with XRE-family HTH domain
MGTAGKLGKRGWSDDRYKALIGKLAEARKAANLHQKELALILGRPQQFVSKVETGERRLDIVEFLDYASALELDPIKLLASIGS